MGRSYYFQCFCNNLCLLLLIGPACVTISLVLYIVLRPFVFLIDLRHERNEASQPAVEPDDDYCYDPEVWGSGSWVLSMWYELPMYLLSDPFDGVVENWKKMVS